MLYTALLGHPVDHSVSPILFQAIANSVGLEYSHLKIDVSRTEDLAGCLKAMSQLGFSGANVTLPYKLAIIPHCSEVDPLARKVGAVNSLVFNGDKVSGFNTDIRGAEMAIKTQLKATSQTDKVLIIGAGGVARAIAYALADRCGEMYVINQDKRQAETMIQELSLEPRAKAKTLTPLRLQWFLQQCDIIVNATPVGMYPDMERRIVPLHNMAQAAQNSDFPRKCFLDAIFNPYKTRFLMDAESFGAKVCSGTYMMIFQALAAFELWTGFKPPANLSIDYLNTRMIQAVKLL
ncbi:MAG: shikimate dehydrogenase [Patescibacteria group bacterium]